MRGNKFAILIACALTSLAGSASADNVLYCSSELATGFIEKKGKYVESRFELKRFTVKLTNDKKRIEGLPSGSLDCQRPYSTVPNVIYCTNNKWFDESFVYNEGSGRFVYTVVRVAGYVNPEGDTDNFYAGVCTSF